MCVCLNPFNRPLNGVEGAETPFLTERTMASLYYIAEVLHPT
jgi:hypothetical protein